MSIFTTFCHANLNNTKDLATTLGHETSHAIDNQDPSIDTNPQNNTSKADNEIYAQNYGDDFSYFYIYVHFYHILSFLLRNSSADLQVKNPPPCSYQSQHNPDWQTATTKT
jgi:hypothetical protein